MKTALALAIIIAIPIVGLAASNPSDPDLPSVDIQVTPPKKTGNLRFQFRTKGKNQSWNDEGGTEILVPLTKGMSVKEKAEAIVASLNASISGFDISSTGGTVHIDPAEGNDSTGRIVIPRPEEKAEEGFKSLDTPDFSSSQPGEIFAVPLEFFSSSAQSPSLIAYEDWIIFDLLGVPTGSSTDGSPGYVGVTANDLEVIVPTNGLTVSEILDFIVAETASFPELQGFPDYSTGRVIILSETLVTKAGIGSHDSGLDIGWTMMDN